LKRLAAPLALLLLLAGLHWKLALGGGRYAWFDHYDLCQLELPRLQFVARSIQAGHFPLWDPHIWGGQPTIGTGQPGVIYPLNLLFIALPFWGVSLMNWLYLSIRVIAGLMMYWLCRDGGLGRWASVLGGLGFASLGFLGSMQSVALANGASWTPLAVLAALRLWRGRRPAIAAAMLAFAMGMCWLTGHHEVPLVLSYALAIAGAVWALRRWSWRVLAWTALAFVLAASIAAVQLLPLAEFGHEAKRWAGAAQPLGWSDRVPYDVHAQYSLSWSALLTEPTLHTGFTIAALALVALIARRGDASVRFAALLALGGMVYVLGANTPLHRLLYEALPMLDKARSPSRGAFLATFALTFLAAHGADLVIRRAPWSGPVLLALVLLEARPVVEARMIPLGQNRTVCADAMLSYGPLAEKLRAEPGVGRVAANHDELMTSLGDFYGFDQMVSFTAGVPAHVLRHAAHTERTQELFGVTHRAGKTAGTDEELAGRFARDVALYRRKRFLPRAWVSHSAVGVKSEDGFRSMVEDAGVDLAHRTPFFGTLPASLESCTGREEVRVSRPDADTVILDATLACAGLVVLSDVNYPGWHATLDGAPADVYEAWGVFRAVRAPAGVHRIEMRYDPHSVMWGAAVSAAGAAATLALAWVGLRQRP
jgi:hypothetical protein